MCLMVSLPQDLSLPLRRPVILCLNYSKESLQAHVAETELKEETEMFVGETNNQSNGQ